MKELSTLRLTLRKPRLEDAPLLFAAYTHDPQVTRYLLWTPHASITDTEAFVARCIQLWEEDQEYNWVITVQGSDAPIGMMRLARVEDAATVGYVLAPSAWGKGYATEATQALVDFAFSEWGIREVRGTCDIENIASSRVMEKAGMEFSGVLPRHALRPALSSQPRDAKLYTLARSNWKKHGV